LLQEAEEVVVEHHLLEQTVEVEQVEFFHHQ
jgi:hypothetical protein